MGQDIKTIFLHVTKACDLRCSYCYFSAGKAMPDEIDRSQYKTIWPQLVAVNPHKVVFTGGEPTLRSDLVGLLEDFRQARWISPDLITCLNSNGNRIDKSLARQLVGLVDEVRISIDALREKNDDLRGKGSFDGAMKGFRHLLEVGFEPKALITVSSYVLSDLASLLDTLHSAGVMRANVNSIRAVGRATNSTLRPVSQGSIEQILNDFKKSKGIKGEYSAPSHCDASPQRTCGVGSFVNILPNGDVYPCHVLTNPLFCCGNVVRDDLLEICAVHGALGSLRSVDFVDLSKTEKQLTILADRGVCLGSVYLNTSQLPVWRDLLNQGTSAPSRKELPPVLR